MAASPLDGLYLFFSIPLGLASLIIDVITGRKSDPNTPQVPTPAAPRMWFSQPRPASDTTTEVVQVNFKVPLSVSEVGWDAVRVGTHTEIWYQDRQNNWRQVLDESRIPVTLDLSASAAQSWYKAHFYCYPIVAKAMQWRIKRVADPVVGDKPYCVGIRNGLIRRNVYTRTDGTMGIEPQQDVLGNTYTSYIKDWDAGRAFDDDPLTFWKSAPMPDPDAVASLYLDVRNTGGGAQLIDTLYIDPVFTGQNLNLYYSNDDTQGTLKLSPITAVPTTDENTQWQQGKGRWDTSIDPGSSNYQFSMAWGPLVRQDAWVGIDWTPDFAGAATDEQQVINVIGTPTGGSLFKLGYLGTFTVNIDYNASPGTVQTALDAIPALTGNVSVSGSSGGPWTVTFIGALADLDVAQLTADNTNMIGGAVGVTTSVPGDPGDAPAQNPVLFQVSPPTATGQFYPSIYYDVGAGTIVLELTDGTTVSTYPCALSPVLVRFRPLRIVVGWSYDPDTVFISVKTPDGTEVGHLESSTTLPQLMTFDGSVGFSDFRGNFTAHVIKLESYTQGQAAFQANPQVYVSPDPVLPDPSGNIPATTLDNAIYAAAWTVQEHGTGGDHESRYDVKTWTPIWRNYISQKGKLYFPQQINLKYLKCEFTKLSEEPYPVYDSGIQVSYKVFPVSVTSDITTKHPGLLGTGLGLLTIGADVVLNGIATLNFLNPATINNAVNSVFGQVRTPTSVTTGAGQVITSLPNTSTLDVTAQTRQELSTPYVYKRSPTDPTTLASQYVRTTTDQTLNQGGLMGAVGNLIGTTIDEVADSFTPIVNFVANPTGLPSQGSDWWVFPGATLRLPSIIMNGLTAVTQTILGRPDTTVRERFNTTSVHRYDIKTVTRDAAVAYFAGVREVQPYVTTYIAELDPVVFQFDSYDPTQWVLNNTKALDSGPITTQGKLYPVLNQQFDFGLEHWDGSLNSGTWDADMTIGHWSLGTAHAVCDGQYHVLASEFFDVSPGDDIIISAWTKWQGLAGTVNGESSHFIELALYDDTGTHLGLDNAFGAISFSDWSTHADGDWTQVSGHGVVPAGASKARLWLIVKDNLTAGQVWFDTVEVGPTDDITATAFKDFITTSTFTKVKCSFTDSGLVRSDSMWTQVDPNDTNIAHTSLAYYTSTIPDVIPAGMWDDSFATWDDPTITWGMPRAVVAIQVDPDRIFDNKRVLHFTRAGGASEAGVKVRQQTNIVANSLIRIGAVFYKPYANDNQVTLRLRRVSDGVYIHEETFDPVVGYWYEYVTDFVEIPDTPDQIYTVELVCTGDDPDEFYLNDLYTEVALGRYFIRLGDSGQYLHDVTQLRYADSAIVSTTTPVNEFSVQVAIMSPKFYAYSATIQPVYLK